MVEFVRKSSDGYMEELRWFYGRVCKEELRWFYGRVCKEELRWLYGRVEMVLW
jgi:hypothetical protein